MFLQIDNFLTAGEIESIPELPHQPAFIDGRRTKPHNPTKHNVIADPNDAPGKQAAQIALTAIQRSEAARNFALPKRVALPVLTRYGIGMTYGAHIDSAFLPGA